MVSPELLEPRGSNPPGPPGPELVTATCDDESDSGDPHVWICGSPPAEQSPEATRPKGAAWIDFALHVVNASPVYGF